MDRLGRRPILLLGQVLLGSGSVLCALCVLASFFPGFLVGAAVLGMAVVGGSMATIIILLNLAIPLWLASLITTLLYAGAAGLLSSSRAS